MENPKNKGELYPVIEDENGMTIFSSKDLCLIDELSEIVEMGIDSLKIEGRLKTENYLASIVNIYRCALDTILDGKEYDKDKFRAEIDKVKTRALTKFNFNIKSNIFLVTKGFLFSFIEEDIKLSSKFFKSFKFFLDTAFLNESASFKVNPA